MSAHRSSTAIQGDRVRQPPPRESKSGCRHCGLPRPPGSEFCCAGCAFVFRLIHDSGFDGYYKIKDQVTTPADVALLPSREYHWLELAQVEAEKDAENPHLRLDVQGISCVGCAWLIEKVFQRQRGAGRVAINAQLGQIELTWLPGQFKIGEFACELQRFNYLLSRASRERSAPLESRPLVKKIGLCAAFTMNVMLFTLPSYFGLEPASAYAHLFGTLSLLFATLSLLVGGTYYIEKAMGSLRLRSPNIDVPIALGIVGAYAGSLVGWLLQRERLVYFDFVSTFILLMLIGRWAQLEAVERNRRRLLAQQPTSPSVSVFDEHGWISRSPEELRTGMRFSIQPGQMNPVEAELVTERLAAGMAWINGESVPRLFLRGQIVPSGAINQTTQDMLFDAREDYEDSLLALLLRPAPQTRHTNTFIERIVKGYLIAIIAIAAGAGAYWYFGSGDALKSYYVITAVLVVSCPCAIGLAFPLVEEIATVALRKQGVFIRSADLWARLARVKTLVFDKTGTLTHETPGLLHPEKLLSLTPLALMVLRSLVRNNPHPVATGIREALAQFADGPTLDLPVMEKIGFGVGLVHEGKEWRLGRADWANVSRNREATTAAEYSVVLCCGGVVHGNLELSDEVRSDVLAEVVQLRGRGLKIAILSGDGEANVSAIAHKLCVSKGEWAAAMTPENKADWIKAQESETTLVLGDGANDSLAFNEAFCRGTPVVHRGVLSEKADFYYLGRGIAGVRALFEMNDRRRRTQTWLLIFSIAYNVFAVSLAVSGRMHPLLAAILMPLSSLLTLGLVGLGMRGVFAPYRSCAVDCEPSRNSLGAL